MFIISKNILYLLFINHHSCSPNKINNQNIFQMLVDFAGDLSSLSHSSTHSLSTLALASVELGDSGNYSCQPASLHKVSITLHVLRAEKEQKLSVKETSDSVTHSEPSQIVLLVLNLCFIYQP